MARTKVTFSLKDFYKNFLQRTYPNVRLSSKQHKLVLETAGMVMTEVILEEGDLKMFGRLGNMMIRKVKPKGDMKAPIDFHLSQQIGSHAYHFNDHSDGYIARILWHRDNGVLLDKHMWLFRGVRSFRRRLSQIMKNGNDNYLILTKGGY